MTDRSGPVFLVGAMRSGTTLLRLMLNRHSQLAIPAESHFLAALFERFPAAALLSRSDLEIAADIVTDNVEWKEDWDGDETALRGELRSLAPLSVGDVIDLVFRQAIAATGKSRWGSKTPAHLFQVPRLRQSIPDAIFIAIVRDPRDAYLSLAPRGWVGSSPWPVSRYLERCNRRVERFRSDGHCDFHVVRYEDLVRDPRPELERLCAAIGLDFELPMLDFHEDASQNLQRWEIDTGVHEKLLRPPSTDDIERWRRTGARRELRQVEALTYGAIRTFGYETTISPGRARALRQLARVQRRLSGSKTNTTTTSARS